MLGSQFFFFLYIMLRARVSPRAVAGGGRGGGAGVRTAYPPENDSTVVGRLVQFPVNKWHGAVTQMQVPSITSMAAMMVGLWRSAGLESKSCARARVSAGHWPALVAKP